MATLLRRFRRDIRVGGALVVAMMIALALGIPGMMVGQAAPDAQAPMIQSSGPGYTLKINSDLVLTNVVVRDKKTGLVVKDLTEKDFTIFENGKPQQLASFDYQAVDQAVQLSQATVSGRSSSIVLGKPGGNLPGDEELRNHRLIVMFFDLTSMQPDDVDRAVEAAKNYVSKQMAPADLVALVSLSTSLSLDQDFTADKQLLLHKVGVYNGSQGQGFAAGDNGTGTNASEDASAYTPDESEYNDINTDRELFALTNIAKSLEKVNQKKSLLYFSGGLTRDGIENQASLRSAINSAVKANLSIYSVDTRGLQAISPLGDATKGSLRGTSAFTGAAVQASFDANFDSQETLSTLAKDTGGKAFFDSNDLAPAFQQVQQDTSAYYVLGFHSSNPLRDGRFRKLTVKLDRSDVKLEYRPGYYAPADFRHSGKDDRERDLEEQLSRDLPATDVSVYLQALYFRVDETHFYVPVSLVVPGSQIPFTKGGDRDKATLDIIGQVKDSLGHIVGDARETVKLAIDAVQEVSRKNIQYSSGFTLPVGKYHLKFVVRENETGHMGSFETDIAVPDMRKTPLKLSSIVLASQRVHGNDKKGVDLLVRDGVQWVPNLPHVFRQDQRLYLLYEVYSPAKSTTVPAVKGQRPPVHVLTSIEFLSGSTKVLETPLVEATQENIPARDAVAFQFEVPLDSLAPGLYTCQVNVIDDAGGSFTFPRMALLVRTGAPAKAQPLPVSPVAAPVPATR